MILKFILDNTLENSRTAKSIYFCSVSLNRDMDIGKIPADRSLQIDYYRTLQNILMLTSIKHSLLHNSSFDDNLLKSLIPRSKKKKLYITSHYATGFLTQLDSISFLQKKIDLLSLLDLFVHPSLKYFSLYSVYIYSIVHVG